MPEKTPPPQNFENHVRTDPKIVAVAVVYLVALILAIVGLFTPVWVTQLALIVTLLGGLSMGLTSRMYSTQLQDRIIRLEMQLRLVRVLPPDLQGRINDLKLGQLISLRFASDAEIPDLMRRALDEKWSGKDIKRAVQDWQADHHRV